jgi:hypothetical protein
MTLILRRGFLGLSRAQLADMNVALEQQRDRAVARCRAEREWITAWLERRADSHDADAGHKGTAPDRVLAHRMAADDLRDAARDLEAVGSMVIVTEGQDR